MNTALHTASRQSLSLQTRIARPLPASERRERAFGVGYGNSSGYASDKRYVPDAGNARFRFA